MDCSTTTSSSPALVLAQRIADEYGALPAVEAVAIAGSQTTGLADAGSDIDLYVYSREPLPLATRRTIATGAASRAEVDNQFWEPGDEWVDAATGIHVDGMFRSPAWIEEQLERVLRRCEAWVGYTTCFWYNVLTSRALYDPHSWFAALQIQAQQPYPEPLRRAIVAKNHPILWQTLSSYRYQLDRAVVHDDPVSINHRVAALLASYFDILFAVNRLPHPGEKRLLAIAEARCPRRPAELRTQVTALLRASGEVSPLVGGAAEALVAGLDALLREEALIP